MSHTNKVLAYLQTRIRGRRTTHVLGDAIATAVLQARLDTMLDTAGTVVADELEAAAVAAMRDRIRQRMGLTT